VAIRRLIVLAATCVFAKQSLGPILCGRFQLEGEKPSHLPPAPLLPKLRGHVAEFLLHGSLEHLRLLASPTCVGLRYGQSQHFYPRLFWAASFESPWQSASTLRSASGLGFRRVFSPPPSLRRCIGTSSTRRLFCFRVPPGDQHTATGTGIFARFPSSTALALDLGAG
jgi:hypothetical protein